MLISVDISPGWGVSTTGPLILCRQSRISGQVVQPVCVDQERQTCQFALRQMQQSPEELRSSLRPSHAAADKRRSEPPVRPGDHSSRSRGDSPLAILGQRQVNGLGTLGGSKSIDTLGTCQRGQPRSRAYRSLRRQPRRANVVPRSGHHQRVSVGALVRVEGPWRQVISHPLRRHHLDIHRPLLPQAQGDADVQHSQPPGPFHPRKSQQPSLGVAKGQRHIKLRAGRIDGARIRVQARRQVQGHEHRPNGGQPDSLQNTHGLAHRASQCP